MEVNGQLHASAALPPGTHWIGGWVGLWAGQGAVWKRTIFCPCRESNPGRPARGPSLCWLSHAIPEMVYWNKPRRLNCFLPNRFTYWSWNMIRHYTNIAIYTASLNARNQPSCILLRKGNKCVYGSTSCSQVISFHFKMLLQDTYRQISYCQQGKFNFGYSNCERLLLSRCSSDFDTSRVHVMWKAQWNLRLYLKRENMAHCMWVWDGKFNGKFYFEI
jgi:hypothetical protein